MAAADMLKPKPKTVAQAPAPLAHTYSPAEMYNHPDEVARREARFAAANDTYVQKQNDERQSALIRQQLEGMGVAGGGGGGVAPPLQAPPPGQRFAENSAVPLTGDSIKDSQNVLMGQAQSSFQGQGQFMDWLNGFMDPSRLDPANDPTMQGLLDAMRRESAESERQAVDASGDQFAASGMYGSSLNALQSAEIRDALNENLLNQQASTMFGARQSALQQQMQGLGLFDQRDQAQANWNQNAASQAGQIGLGNRGLDVQLAGQQAQLSAAQAGASGASAGAYAQLEAAKYQADIERELGMRGYDVQEMLGFGGQDVQMQLGLAGYDTQAMLGMSGLDLQRELGLRGIQANAASGLMGADFAGMGMMGSLGGQLAGQSQAGMGIYGGLMDAETQRILGAAGLGGTLAGVGAQHAGIAAQQQLGQQQLGLQNAQFQQSQYNDAFQQYLSLLLGSGDAFGKLHQTGSASGSGAPYTGASPLQAGIQSGLGAYMGAGGTFGGGGGGG
jgi:hypothetical protein